MWHVLPENKSIWIGLTTIYGIWLKKSETVLAKVKIDKMKKISDIVQYPTNILHSFLLSTISNV